MEGDVQRTKRYDSVAYEQSLKYKGKIQTLPKVPITSLQDFSVWYTPGVAEVSRRIKDNTDLSFELTGRWNSVAIVTDGTRVLGLGNVGPEAAMPVMEGKSLIFNYLGGINAIPLPLRASGRDEFIATVKALEPSFGAFNLEDIESPKCFFVLQALQKSMEVPVWHDDQLGTASITLAGLLNALKVVGKKREDVTVTLIGSGAANVAIANLLIAAGFRAGNMYLVDHMGILQPERADMDKLMLENPLKYDLAMKTNAKRKKDGIEAAMKGADIVISASKSEAGFIHKEWVQEMNDDGIVFALANPVPEIWPKDAKDAGAKVVATGRSDFPNQINNSLVFPSLFRGVLDARAKGVNFEVMIAASEEIARFIEEPEPDRIVPTMDQWEMYPTVAATVAYKTVELGLARRQHSREWFLENATEIIDANRRIYSSLLKTGLIKKMEG